MNELLWNPNITHRPLDEQEYVELSLVDPPNPWGDSYVVRRKHYRWNDGRRQMMPSDFIVDELKTLEEAKARYEVHRQLLSEMGFSRSDMDPML